MFMRYIVISLVNVCVHNNVISPKEHSQATKYAIDVGKSIIVYVFKPMINYINVRFVS